MSADGPAAEIFELTRAHVTDGAAIVALDHASLAVSAGEVVAVTGPSGSGKSTLLFLLAGLDLPDEGRAVVAGVDWATLQGAERARFRRRNCGFVAQGMALLPQATAAENIEVPLLLDGVDAGARASRVGKALNRVGLAKQAPKLPDQLSGGQQQRVAIARALVTEPAVILADEPTGNLDSETGQAVARLLVEAAKERAAAVVLVTHDPEVARHADRIVEIHSGRLSEAAS